MGRGIIEAPSTFELVGGKRKKAGFKRGCRPFSEEDMRTLKAMYGKNSVTSIADLLNRSPETIRVTACRIGLSKNREELVWSDEEINILKNRYFTDTAKSISTLINRTPGAIHRMAKFLKLTAYRVNYSIDIIDVVKQHVESGLTTKEISKILHRSQGKLTAYCRKNGYDPVTHRKSMRLSSMSYDGNRYRVRRDANKSCEICGFDRGFDCAHIVPHRKGGPFIEWNILILCPNHHYLFDNDGLTTEEYSKVKSRVECAFEKFNSIAGDK